RCAPPSASAPLFCCKPPAPTPLYTLSLHDALPISPVDDRAAVAAVGRPGAEGEAPAGDRRLGAGRAGPHRGGARRAAPAAARLRSEEHTSELQSLAYLVCRLLLEKKKIKDKG